MDLNIGRYVVIFWFSDTAMPRYVGPTKNPPVLVNSRLVSLCIRFFCPFHGSVTAMAALDALAPKIILKDSRMLHPIHTTYSHIVQYSRYRYTYTATPTHSATAI